MRRLRAVPLGLLWVLGCANADVQNGPDAGPISAGTSALTPCQKFLLRVCGDATGNPDTSPCRSHPSCTGGQLTAQYEPARCAERDQDLVGWETCDTNRLGASPNTQAQTCTDLLTKACGAPNPTDRPCETESACATAHEVVDTAAQGDATPCVQALGDDTAFPRCNKH